MFSHAPRLRGLGPLLLQIGTLELLYDDTVTFYEKAMRSGVSVELDCLPHMPHAAANLAAFAPEGQRSIERAATFLRKHLEAP